MGQVHVISVRTESLPLIREALHRAGFEVQETDEPGTYRRIMRCQQRGRELQISAWDSTEPEETLLTLGHPPYSIWPWHWVGDQRFFDDVAAILDEFHYRD